MNEFPYWSEYVQQYTAWLDISSELNVEYRQCELEGKDIAKYEAVLKAISEMPSGDAKKKLAESLYEALQNEPLKEGYPYVEPSELSEIQAARPAKRHILSRPDDVQKLRSRIAGAWYGRICGCLLGKPIEGWRSWQIEELCKANNNYPLNRYLVQNDEILKKFNRGNYGCWINKVNGAAPSDDDTNYTVIGTKIIETCGRDFTPSDMALTWLKNLPIRAVCTAERVAYRNFVAGIKPPYSASYLNPYREYIGAQIRGDYFGYINPGDTQTAADMAWRDASISHIKNGIYGEMFIAAMLAAAAVSDDIITVIEAGLDEIPEKSRLYDDVSQIIELYREGKTEDEALAHISSRFNENIGFDWCYTNSNAMIVAVALLWGEKDYTKTICLSVKPGFDTDCNGATSGSVLGMMIGAENIPEQWTSPICGTLETSIEGYRRVSLDEMVDITLKHMN